MHRLLCSFEEISSDTPTLSGDSRNHLKVLRPKDGELFELFDGNGASRVFKYSSLEKCLKPAGELSLAHKDATRTLTLFACVTKSSRWDWTLEKATELGADRIVPVISERTIVRIPKVERAAKKARWVKIVQEAARQSDALFVPEILEPLDFAEALDLARASKCFVGALMDPAPKMLLKAVEGSHSEGEGGDYSVFIGPEGDFSPTELAAILEFAQPVSLGSRILRAETAAIYSLAVMAAALERQ